MEEITGNTIDISKWLDFEFYDLVWYWDEAKMDLNEDQRYGSVLHIESAVIWRIGS
jgi:hypothetical protein